jgi:imidazolonepropionase-like amidohydrolase
MNDFLFNRMSRVTFHRNLLLRALLTCVGAMALLASAGAAELLPPGFHPHPLGVHALVDATVVTKPGETLEGGTIIIRDGFIQAVGKDLVPPADARIWEMKGTTIYAGFIDPYIVLGATNPPISTSGFEPVAGANALRSGAKFFGAPGVQTDMGTPGPGYDMVKITPQYRAVRDYSPRNQALAPLRELGFTAGVIAPNKGILRGTSALVVLSEEDPNEVILKPDVFQHVAFETHSDDERSYPGSLMGVIAAIRQTFFDTQHYALDTADYQKHPQGRKRPPFDPALEALLAASDKKMPVAFEPGSALMDDRAARLAAELHLDFCLVSCGQEWRRPDLAQAVGATFIVPLNFPTLPKLPSDEDWEQVSLEQLRAWDWAAENPALLRQHGRTIALTTYGLSDKKKFRPNLRLALDRGLRETDALAALTTVPAQLCGIADQLGTIEAGKLANLTVVEGKSYFEADAKVREVWIDGRIYRGPSEEPKPEKAQEAKPAKTSAPETAATPSPRPEEEPEKHPNLSEAAKPETKKEAKAGEAAPAPEAKAKDQKKEQLRELQKTRVAQSPLEGRGPLPLPKADPVTHQPGLPDPNYHPTNIIVRNATLWLCDEKGTIITNGTLWVRNGKIAGAGAIEVPPTADALEIDGHGLQVTPGLIDCHSHSAILGTVNESTLPSTAMVRISDVVNSESENIYRELAGGLTIANLLHGSANPIGGQSCVIKLRDGAAPSDLIFDAAPAGIKFALGENPKQANWGAQFSTRFPQTRMGVRTFLANRFTAAREYLAEWDAYRKATNSALLTAPKHNGDEPSAIPHSALRAPHSAVPPRRDLELETLGEILQGQRWIHCHCYRQDEILMLLRTMESFGVKVGTLQHVLEGYKVADEIAQAGVGGSTFSDWWAYKFEVYDAIPYNGSLMHDRGVLVSFNSDSSELARRLYSEAAKAVKYGGTPETEALKFVTLNPAKQLRIQQRVGSLEPGKDADFVLWSHSPLDSRTVCLQTWIEGRKYFDRAFNAPRAARLAKERADLIAKAKRLAKLSGGGESAGGEESGSSSFFRTSLEHEFDGRERHCLDEE